MAMFPEQQLCGFSYSRTVCGGYLLTQKTYLGETYLRHHFVKAGLMFANPLLMLGFLAMVSFPPLIILRLVFLFCCCDWLHENWFSCTCGCEIYLPIYVIATTKNCSISVVDVYLFSSIFFNF
jgi:hypothetical protein